MKHTAFSTTLPWAIHDPRTWRIKTQVTASLLGAGSEQEKSKREREKEKGRERWSSMVMNIHFKCMAYDHSTVRHACLYIPVQWKFGRGGVPVNSNLPAITCMSTLDKIIPAAQICHNIWAITEIDLMRHILEKQTCRYQPSSIYIHTYNHTLVVVVVTLVVNFPLHY